MPEDFDSIALERDNILELAYANSICELQSDKNVLLAHGRIVRMGPATLDIRQREEDASIAVHYGMPVKINVYNIKLGFKVLTGIIKGYSDEIIRVSGLEVLQASERRDFVRVPLLKKGNASALRIIGTVDYYPFPFEVQVRVQVENLSLSGIQFACFEAFPKRSRLLVSFTPQQELMQSPCEVVRSFKDALGRTHYGGRLLDQRETQVDELSKLLLKLQLQQRGKRD